MSRANAQSGLSQNSGINSSDTWAAFDMTTQIQATSNSITRPTITQTFHTEIGYDANGLIVVNLWPTGPVPSDAGGVSVIRLSGGNITVFDQNGAPIPYVPPVGNVPAFNPLSLLGSNPGSSILSQLVVSNIQQRAQTTNSQLSYSGSDALLLGPVTNSQTSDTAQWTYAPSGNVWVATQVVTSLAWPNFSATHTLQFSNLHWSDNATNDAARANNGSTAINPPPPTASTPAAMTASSSSNCPPNLSNQGGAQNVVFQHGTLSSGCTWWRMVPWLNQYFRFGNELVPSLNSLDNLTNQGNALINDINSTNAINYFLIGHSQGGLISRYAAQHYQSINSPAVAGVVTLDTPHEGAPVAGVPQGLLQNVLLGDMANVWGDVGCTTAYDNILCFLTDLQYSGMSAQLINIGALTDLVPGSAFLNNLNSQSENFKKAAVIGNTNRRWIEVRVAANLLGCNPEDACGERNVASIYGIVNDSLDVSYGIAELVCVFTGDQTACDIADYLLRIILDMNLADFDYNYLVAGLAPEDGIVPSSSQNYPSSSAVQYPIGGADSHLGATRSDLARNALEQALAAFPFSVQTQASCGFSASPAVFSISGDGGSGTIGLSTGGGCQWSAVSQTPWISITTPSGTSGGNVGFTVAANPSTIPRSGTVQAGNGVSAVTFTVNQAGLCTYSLTDGTTIVIQPSGGTYTVPLYAGAGCVWSAVSNASWLTITAGASGTGSGSFSFTAAPNSGTTDLSGTITVMSQTLTVVIGSPVGSPGSGTVTINGSPQSATINFCPQWGWCPVTVAEFGSVSVTVAGMTFTTTYDGSTTGSEIASYLASQMSYQGSLLSATVSGTTITITSAINGAATNYPLSTSYTFQSIYSGYQFFSGPAFTAVPSGSALTGGTN